MILRALEVFRKRPLGRQRTYEDNINKDLTKWVMIRRGDRNCLRIAFTCDLGGPMKVLSSWILLPEGEGRGEGSDVE